MITALVVFTFTMITAALNYSVWKIEWLYFVLNVFIFVSVVFMSYYWEKNERKIRDMETEIQKLRKGE